MDQFSSIQKDDNMDEKKNDEKIQPKRKNSPLDYFDHIPASADVIDSEDPKSVVGDEIVGKVYTKGEGAFIYGEKEEVPIHYLKYLLKTPMPLFVYEEIDRKYGSNLTSGETPSTDPQQSMGVRPGRIQFGSQFQHVGDHYNPASNTGGISLSAGF
jgi:hypothetical protein